MRPPRTPSDLGTEGKRFWKKVLSEFAIRDTHDLERLKMAGKCLDDLAEAEKRVKTDGMFAVNRYGKTVEHPGLKIIRDSRMLFLKTMRELCLDTQTPGESRPKGLY